jgi:hypothetical protein
VTGGGTTDTTVAGSAISLPKGGGAISGLGEKSPRICPLAWATSRCRSVCRRADTVCSRSSPSPTAPAPAPAPSGWVGSSACPAYPGRPGSSTRPGSCPAGAGAAARAPRKTRRQAGNRGQIRQQPRPAMRGDTPPVRGHHDLRKLRCTVPTECLPARRSGSLASPRIPSRTGTSVLLHRVSPNNVRTLVQRQG